MGKEEKKIKRKWGELTLRVLEIIGGVTAGNVDFMEAFLRAGYGASFGNIQYQLGKIEERRLEGKIKEEEKQKYYSLIYRLKKQGLIQEKQKDGKKFFILSKKGKEKRLILKNYFNNKLPSVYLVEESANWIIVSFDVPEEERKKRDWLRGILKNHKFTMLHQSTWIGKKRLPKEFIDDLFKYKLNDYIEIFEISKTGSLKHIV